MMLVSKRMMWASKQVVMESKQVVMASKLLVTLTQGQRRILLLGINWKRTTGNLQKYLVCSLGGKDDIKVGSMFM